MVAPLVEVKPFIIVDNKRISPIGRSIPPGSATDNSKESHQLEFGIVDRVTISKAAREKSKWYHAQTRSNLTINDGLPHRSSRVGRSLLTYSPKQKG
jgi:hypothetical protein